MTTPDPMEGFWQLDLLSQLDRAATWRERIYEAAHLKPDLEAMLFRKAADRIRTLEETLQLVQCCNDCYSIATGALEGEE
jgi:hypothetical protein